MDPLSRLAATNARRSNVAEALACSTVGGVEGDQVEDEVTGGARDAVDGAQGEGSCWWC